MDEDEAREAVGMFNDVGWSADYQRDDETGIGYVVYATRPDGERYWLRSADQGERFMALAPLSEYDKYQIQEADERDRLEAEGRGIPDE